MRFFILFVLKYDFFRHFSVRMVLVRPNSYILPLCRLRKTAGNGGRIVLYVCPALCSEKAEKHQSDEGKESQMSTAKGLHDGHRAVFDSVFLRRVCADLKVIRSWKCFSFMEFPAATPMSWRIA